MKLESRSQLVLAAIIIIVFFTGILFFYLNRANQRVAETEATTSISQTFVVINPDGNAEIYTANNPTGPLTLTVHNNFRQIVTAPVAGYTIVMNGLTPKIRYVRADTGQVYDYEPESNNETRITDATIPKVTDAQWINDENVFMRFHEDGQEVNYLGAVDESARSLGGQNLPADLVSVVGLGQDIAYYLVKDELGSSLYQYNFNTNNSRFEQAFDLSYLDLTATTDLDGNQELFAVSRLSPNHKNQVVYQIDPAINSHRYWPTPTKTSQGTIITDQTLVQLTSEAAVITDRDTNEAFIVPGIFTMAKCGAQDNMLVCAEASLTPSQARGWPLNWFKGAIRPTESLVAIDLFTGRKNTLTDLQNLYDVSQIQVTDDYVYFISRRDGGLYEYFIGDRF